MGQGASDGWQFRALAWAWIKKDLWVGFDKGDLFALSVYRVDKEMDAQKKRASVQANWVVPSSEGLKGCKGQCSPKRAGTKCLRPEAGGQVYQLQLQSAAFRSQHQGSVPGASRGGNGWRSIARGGACGRQEDLLPYLQRFSCAPSLSKHARGRVERAKRRAREMDRPLPNVSEEDKHGRGSKAKSGEGTLLKWEKVCSLGSHAHKPLAGRQAPRLEKRPGRRGRCVPHLWLQREGAVEDCCRRKEVVGVGGFQPDKAIPCLVRVVMDLSGPADNSHGTYPGRQVLGHPSPTSV